MHEQPVVRKKRKYIGIAKVGYNHMLKQPVCVKYRFNDENKIVEFLRNKYPGLCWLNIFLNTGAQKGKLIATWGKSKGFLYN